MRYQKRIESILSAIDIGSNSVITLIAFLFIKDRYGIDIAGYYGLVLSIASFGETIQQGLYENPVFLNYGIGYKKFNLNLTFLSLIIFLPLLLLNIFFIKELLFSSFVFAITYVLIQNIRVYDYKKNSIKNATIRSTIIFLITTVLIAVLYFKNISIQINTFLFLLSITKIIYLFKDIQKIFYFKNKQNNDNNFQILLTSFLTLIKSRFPMWLLLPFGLGLIGIFESFRTILEIFLSPSRPVIMVLYKNYNNQGVKNTLKFSLFCSILSFISVFFTYFQIIKLKPYSIPELNSIFPFLSLLIIIPSYWISETMTIIFQSSKLIKFETKKRVISLILFLLIGLIFYNKINFNFYILLISSMYLFEVIYSSFIYFKFRSDVL